MMRPLIYLCAIVTTPSLVAAAPSPAPSRPDVNLDALRTLERQAWPFGRVGPADEDRLQDFALKRGFDLKAEMSRVYCCEKKIDEDALAHVFMFSRQFDALDKNARTYGQIIFSSLLRIGEVLGVPYYVSIIERQPPDVQQRIRDFLYYPDWRDHRDQNRETYDHVYPGLFPKSYHFAHDDPIFAKET
jgi:hypothetical protein